MTRFESRPSGYNSARTQTSMSGTNMSTSMEQARFNMVEQQVRPWNVVDEDVLRTLRSVPREDFVQPEYRRLAVSDVRISVGLDQVMMKPRSAEHTPELQS